MYKVGVDLGGTNIVAGIVTEAGNILHKESIKTRKNIKPSDIVKDVYKVISKVLLHKNIQENEVSHIGIGIPGSCDYEKGLVIFTPNINLSGTNIVEKLQTYTNIPIYIENDANCATLGENFYGSAKAYNSSVTITLGTGVGVGVVLKNNLMRGSVEAGHHIINIEGPKCGCGKKGCFESYSSATALINRAKKVATRNPTTKMLSLVGGDINNIEAKTVFDAAKQGDSFANILINSYIFYLSIGISNLINCYPINAVILGGGISNQGDYLINPLKEELKKLYFGSTLNVQLIKAELGNDAGIVGAALLGIYYPIQTQK